MEGVCIPYMYVYVLKQTPMVQDNAQCQIEGFIFEQWRKRPEEVGPLEELSTKVCHHQYHRAHLCLRG